MMMKRKDVVELTGLCYTTIYNLEKKGSFPKRRQLSPGRVAWVRVEVEGWLKRCELTSAGKAEVAAGDVAVPCITLLHQFRTDTHDIAYWSDKELTITKRDCTV